MKFGNSHKFGIVFLKEWIAHINGGGVIRALSGPIQMINMEKDLDVPRSSQDSRWGMHIGNDTEGFFVPGCQIRSVYWGPRKKVDCTEVFEVV